MRKEKASKLEAIKKVIHGTKHNTTISPPTYNAPDLGQGQVITMDRLDVNNLPNNHQVNVYDFYTHFQMATNHWR